MDNAHKESNEDRRTFDAACLELRRRHYSWRYIARAMGATEREAELAARRAEQRGSHGMGRA